MYARNLKRKIVPLFYKPCDLPLGFHTLHFIDVQGSKYLQNYKEILRALDIKRSDREIAEKAVLAKVEKEVAEKAEREAVEKAAREKAEREAVERAVREKAEKESTEKAAREKAEREAAQKAEHEKEKQKNEREKLIQKPEQSKVQTAPRSSSSQVLFWVIGLIGVVLLFVLLSMNNNGTTPLPVSTSTQTPQSRTPKSPTSDQTFTPTFANTPSATNTLVFTLTPTHTKTRKATNTAIKVLTETQTPGPYKSGVKDTVFNDSVYLYREFRCDHFDNTTIITRLNENSIVWVLPVTPPSCAGERFYQEYVMVRTYVGNKEYVGWMAKDALVNISP